MIAQRVAHYVIIEKIGEGGMGVVYRARDEKLQRDVALKFLGVLPSGSSASHEQVLEEARAISALNHPNICTVYEVGEADDKPYIAMEFVQGRQLSEEIRSTGMALDQVERYGIQLAEALSHAHSRGIIHRDLKSANVMITPSGLLKVLDFGISRRMDQSAGEGTTRFDKSWESQHTFTGTLPYVAPEVFKGQEADERGDIWSLGVLLYEMVAGRRPFHGATAYELGAAIMRERQPEITQKIPQVLQSVIDKCLNKDPGQRYQSAGEVRAALETAGTASRTQKFLTMATPSPGIWTWKNVILLCAVAALAVGLGYWMQARKNPKLLAVPGAVQSIAVLPLDNLSGDPSQEYFADGMTDALITELSQIKKLRVISRTTVMQYKHTQKPLHQIAQELRVDAIVEGSVVRAGDRVRISAKLMQTNIEGSLWADSFERQYADVLALQSDVATAIARGIQVELSSSEQMELARNRSVVPEAYEFYLKGRYELAKRTQEGFLAAEEYFKRATEEDGSFAAAYAGLAEVYLSLDTYQLQPAKETIPKAKQAAEKALQLDDRLAQAHSVMAAIRFYNLELQGVEIEYQRAIALNPGFAQGLHWYGLYLAAMGRKEESLTEIKLARDIDPKSLIINANVGWCHYLARDFDKSIEAEKETLRLDPSFGISYGYLGQALLEKGQFESAIEAFRKNVSLEPSNLSRKSELANAYFRAGRQPQGAEIVEEFKRLESTRYVPSYDWAMIYAGQRDKTQTMKWLELGYEERNARLVNLAIHPQFMFLHGDPRFEALLAKIGFPTANRT
jgi:serine/threonine protein kinase/tetratricopeptide (TPR) repeat protein